jgi:hypothetical protein
LSCFLELKERDGPVLGKTVTNFDWVAAEEGVDRHRLFAGGLDLLEREQAGASGNV